MMGGIGEGAPYLYDYVNSYNALGQPSTSHSTDATLTRFFTRYLFQRAMSVFKWEMPRGWDQNYVLYTLYLWGYFAVFNTDKYGIIPQGCGLKGYGVQYQPTNCVITNPLFRKTYEPTIGKDCVLIRLQPDYGGISDLVSFYADMMSTTATTAGVNIANSKLSYVFVANSKAIAESMKKMFDGVASGQQAVFGDKAMFDMDGKPMWSTFTQSLKSNYIAGDLLDDMRSWEKRFDAEVGIPTTNTEKRERLVADEVNANSEESRTRADMWLDELKRGCKEAEEMFGIKLSVDWRIKDATRNTDTNGSLQL